MRSNCKAVLSHLVVNGEVPPHGEWYHPLAVIPGILIGPTRLVSYGKQTNKQHTSKASASALA